METVNLLPSDTVAIGLGWDIIGSAGTAHEALADADDSTLIRNDTVSESVIFLLDDFNAGLGQIMSIRFFVRGVLFNTRSGSTTIRVNLTNESGYALWNEGLELNFTGGYTPEDHYGTARTTSVFGGTNAWSPRDLNGLRLYILVYDDPPGASYAQITRAHVEVTYSPENSVFFGANF